MTKKYILFDLDGTISNSAKGVLNGVLYALEKYGINEEFENLYSFLGPPLFDEFKKRFNMSDDEANTAVKNYREYYTGTGVYENVSYDGIEEVFKKLRNNGKQLILATSKPEKYAKIIMDTYGFTKYFSFIGGASLTDKSRNHKDAVIEYCLSECKITNPDECIMIGDREHDVNGAKKYGIETIGVLYGYGTEEELRTAGAKYIAGTPDEICEILFK